MSDIKLAYGTAGQALTISLGSLADGGIRESTAVDNGTNLYGDALVMVKVKTGASGGDAGDVVRVYAYGTVDGGTTYSGEATGSDSDLSSTDNLVLLCSIPCEAATTTFYSPVLSVAQAFGGVLPEEWGIVIEDATGAALDATDGNHSVQYQGVYATVA